jgi:hypothetical protein
MKAKPGLKETDCKDCDLQWLSVASSHQGGKGTHGIHAMALIRGETKTFSTENMSQMSMTARTQNLTTSEVHVSRAVTR